MSKKNINLDKNLDDSYQEGVEDYDNLDSPVDVDDEIIDDPIKEKIKPKEITDLPGIGPTSAEKLKAAGYETYESIAVASPMELVAVASLGEGTAIKAIKAARDALEMGFESAEKILDRRKLISRITTGSSSLDELLGGGIESQSITEVYGKFASGKSQWCFQLCVTAQLPKDQGGLDGAVLYIDTENSFRPERVSQIAQYRGLDPEKVMKNIFVARAYNSDHQMLLAEKGVDLIKDKNIKLVIVDSLTSQFRSEFTGRGQLSDRQQKINKHMRLLQKIAELYNVVVFVTNQVMSRPDILFGDPTDAIGGNVVKHASKTRVYLRKGTGSKRIAKLVDSPSLPDGEAVYNVTGDGLVD
ncbi:MAG: DNA repair and recombination protein RadA [Candidatus ainarchaeum sp.]|nr:DNA repair and recombination protein RadA [Candidatus ainarchaeum sp.]MDD3975674.1 DNA repair and recombination protein RadA [Candidatus ainarchaeum sp.]